ncbi:MAG TPA: LTA synthase family protein [Ghiorsea sp.]|nr:LTA synthase family protein [Ghiorsea sp.]
MLDWKTRPTLYFIRLMSVFFILFFLLRLAFLWVYPETFAELTVGDTVYAMLKGAWFMDSSIIMVFLGIPFLLTYLPIPWFRRRQWYLTLVSWYAFILLFVFALIAIGDLQYFGLVHRHTGHELAAAMQTSTQAMIDMLVSAYGWQMLALVMVMVASAFVWQRYMMPHPAISHLKLGWKRIPFFVVMFVIVLLTMRGGIESKPIQSVFAYNEGSMAQGHLTLNGVFATFHSLSKSKMRMPDFMPQEEAVDVVQAIYTSPYESIPDARYPLMRERTSPNVGQEKLNVVILLLESWDPDFIDITRQLAGKKPYGVTPNYNALAKKGRLYTNFYANGQRSIDGIAAVIAGIPRVPGAGGIGEGIEVNGIGWMGNVAKSQGYQTSFLSGSYRHSFYMDKIAPLAGFDTYYGSEDLKSLHSNPPKSHWGGWDYDLFMAGHALFAQSEQPFLSVMFSVSTHTPWALPEPRFQKFKGDSDEERFLNTMYYTDWALGEFFKAVEGSTYADNTIFLLFADHASGNMPHPNMREQYRVPLLMVGAHIEPSIDDTLSSQIDLIPTIIDLAGWEKAKYASLGSSIVEQRANRSVIFGRDAMTGRIEDNGSLVVRSLERVVHSEGEPEQVAEAEHRLKAQVQVLLDAWQHNTLMKVEK